MRISPDANVLFSATQSDAPVGRFLVLLTDAGHECWANGYVAEEARRLSAKARDPAQDRANLYGPPRFSARW